MARLDETDMRILSALYADASISVPQLSKELGVNLSVTYSRIKRLQKRGIIERFTVQVNEDQLGMKARALAGLNIDPKQREAVLGEIEKVDGVRTIREVTGRFDLIVNMRGRSLDELHRTVYEVIGKIPGVMHAELFMEVSRRISRVNFKIVDS
ncbi:MAG TPA: Lrp/AsnC family transcriptional regulator [Nitrososphaerales archaeon]|nr:Lrp/AsnC family transcriptional regulator [Nitrososphaerales archaeon]